jgi:hypothetical protein
MTEMVGLSRALSGRPGMMGGLLLALRTGWRRLTAGRRAPRLQAEAWPDYLLRDVGLGREAGSPTDPRALPMDWPPR